MEPAFTVMDRRSFLRAGSAAVGLWATLDLARARAALAGLASRAGGPAEAAADEDLWFEVQQAFTVDRSLVNLNNGGVSPSPTVVQEAMKRHLDYSNQAPAFTMWQVLEPQRETVRARLAAAFGCDAEEMALTRNASEGLQICQLGFDLEAGDEVLTTTQDYPRMITTFLQRQRREGIVLRQFSLPVPAEDPEEVVDLYRRHLTDRTRLILMCHVVNLTGQILPVRQVVAMARKRGIPVVVDGAHAFAHLEFQLDDVACDYYATSLHKWLFAPHGTGFLFVRRERIPGLWPLQAASAEMEADVRKFEEIGTHPAANYLAIAEALTFHEGLGAARKQARLRYLRDRWAKRLAADPRVRLLTSLDPRHSCALATFAVAGVGARPLAEHLWKRHRILTVAIEHPEFQGIRVTPSVYTTLAEIDRFADAVEGVIARGLPAA